MSAHHLKLTMQRGYLDAEFTCTAPEGASCRGECAVKCGAWSDGQGCDCPKVDSGECQALTWITEGGTWEELYGGDPHDLVSGDVVFEWDGDGFSWRYGVMTPSTDAEIAEWRARIKTAIAGGGITVGTMQDVYNALIAEREAHAQTRAERATARAEGVRDA